MPRAIFVSVWAVVGRGGTWARDWTGGVWYVLKVKKDFIIIR